MMELVHSLMGKQNFQRGKVETRQGKYYNSNLAGKHISLAGHPFTLAGQRFSGVITGDLIKINPRHNKQQITE